MTEPEKKDSDVELPSLSLPGDEVQIAHDSVPFGEIGLREEPELGDSLRGVPVSETRAESDDGDDGGYRVNQPPPASVDAAPTHDATTPECTFEPRDSTADAKPLQDFPHEPPPIDDVWSRWTEWKEPFLWTAAAIGVVLLIHFGGALVTGLILLAGLSHGAYHFVISLEVPVRTTAEQAVKEFFAALGHRLPNYPRAYALLTGDGRQSEDFSDLGDFRAYWNAQLARLSKFPAWLTPLEFRVEGVTCRYNPEKTMALLTYKLRVAIRGKSPDGPALAEMDSRNLAVKGRDGQWYLNDGRMPSLEKDAGKAAEPRTEVT